MSKQEERRALEEIYLNIPIYQPSEDDMRGLYKQYESFMKEDEASQLDLDDEELNLDPDFDLE